MIGVNEKFKHELDCLTECHKLGVKAIKNGDWEAFARHEEGAQRSIDALRRLDQERKAIKKHAPFFKEIIYRIERSHAEFKRSRI
ncbi:hypothetical protein [Oceanobacillus sojae]|uniref:Uncharacterized protein n=1 Tax=Oceanobacillus sojae TaxID=582851 RepID=A0A511ZID7_9BACI|nr:hypothetical protein [Oceanobacillus sojae]GEN87208.1 hypothetical protein OSO01_19470 [Oceanobacillus sojae]